MKFLLDVLSVTFFLMKTGWSLSCYNVGYNDSSCRSLEGIAFVKCWSKHKIQKSENCNFMDAKCLTYTIKLTDADETEMEYKACDASELICNAYKRETQYKISKDIIKQAQCEYCTTDLCNGDQLTTTSTARTKVGELNCRKVMYDSEACKDKEDDINDLVECYKKHKIDKSEKCESEHPACLSWTLRLKDQTEIMWKGCDSSGTLCETFKQIIGKPLTEKDYVEYSRCEFCDQDMCNENESPEVTRAGRRTRPSRCKTDRSYKVVEEVEVTGKAIHHTIISYATRSAPFHFCSFTQLFILIVYLCFNLI